MRKKSQMILISILLIIGIGFGVAVGYLAWIIKTAPDITKLSQYKPSEASTIYSTDGEVLNRLYIENRIYVPLAKIPMNLQNALVASEDQKFWEHNGINFWAILRAIYVDIKTMSKAQGASTITQLLARNMVLHQQKSWTRKIQEAYIAIQLERMYTKEEILEMLLNHIFFGHSALGVQTAAQQYFGKNVEDLTLGESAMLIGIMPAPNRYSPYNDLEVAKLRRAKVLNQMVELGFISEERAEQGKKEDVKLVGLNNGTDSAFASYFNRYIRDKLKQMFGDDLVYRGGLKVYTTLDPKMQQAAEDALQTAIDPEKGYLPTINREKGEDPIQPQVSLISIDPRNGHIKAMIGGRNDDKFNRATQAFRQPGSAFKPIVYATALEIGYSPGDVVDDLLGYFDPGNPNPWPTNYNDKYLGPISLRYALAHSVNVASVRLLDNIGIDPVIDMAERLQITSIVKNGKINDRNLGFTLGGLTKGIKSIEMASAYGVFANKGIYVEPIAILKVEDANGHVLYQASPSKKIVLQEDTAYMITNMLQSVINSGTGWRANLGRPVAGKTGTTSDSKDAWFVGYTPDIVTSVWIGEDHPRAMIYDETDENGNLLYSENGQPMKISSSEATKLWGAYMREAVKGREVLGFEQPNNIITVAIDPATGKLPNAYTPKVVKEIYREGNEPTEVETLHQPFIKVGIDYETGQLATPECPVDQIVESYYQEATGIRVGPATFNFTVQRENEEKPRKFIYNFPEGVPIPHFDPESGAPLLDENGNYRYQYLPTEKCQVHSPASLGETVQTGAKKLIDTIWNFFNNDTSGDDN